LKDNITVLTKDDRVYQFDEWVNKTFDPIVYTSDKSMVKTLIEESIVKELCDKRVMGLCTC
jgi:hypothetical protein